MQAKAILRDTPTSPRKMRLVAGLVRGKQVDLAKAILLNSTKAASRNVMQTLKSAVANYAQLNPDERVSDQELALKASRALKSLAGSSPAPPAFLTPNR